MNHGFVGRINNGFYSLDFSLNVASFLYLSFLSNQTELLIFHLKSDSPLVFTIFGFFAVKCAYNFVNCDEPL